MKTDKSSVTLTRVMLFIFMLLLSAAVVLKASDLSHKSYGISLCAAFACAAAAVFLLRHIRVKREKEISPAVLLGLLSILCFAVNFAWTCFMHIEPTVDFSTFWNTAKNIAERNRLTNTLYLGLFPHIVGYSSFLAVFLRLFGSTVTVAVVLNVLLTTVSGAAIFLICLRRHGIKTAAWAYGLWIFCPSKMIYNTMVLSEPLYTALLLVFMLILSELESCGNHKKLIALFAFLGAVSGAILAFTNAVRPIGAIVIIAFFIWRLVIAGREAFTRQALCRWGSFAAAMLAVCAAGGKLWDNYLFGLLGERPAAIPAYNMYVGFNPDSLGSYSDEDMDLLIQYRTEPGGSAEAAQSRMLEELKTRLASGEVNYGRLFTAKLRTFLGNDEGGAFYAQEQISPMLYKLCSLASNVYYYFVVIFALVGAADMMRRRERSSITMLPLYVIGLTLAHMLVEVAGRYHYSVIPMLVMLSALGLTYFQGKKTE